MRRLLALCVCFVLACLLPGQAVARTGMAVDATGADLVSMTSGLDGQTVTFEGEVVSEALAGGREHVWLNVLSDGVAIGVWMPEAMAGQVEEFGRWSHDGDIVRITGVLNEACDTHGGDLDVHAEELTVLTAGTARSHSVEYWKLVPGLAGLMMAYAIVRRAWRREERPS